MGKLDELSNSVVQGDVAGTVAGTKAALGKKVPAAEILEKGLLPGLSKVGDLFAKGELYFPELLMAGEAMKTAVEILKPELGKKKVRGAGKFLIGTVREDLHDIGKNIVVMFLEANGWEVTDIGVDNSPQKFCEAVKNGDYDIVGLSALLTLSMPWQAETITALKKAGLRDKVKVMVGGVSITQKWADEIGADAYGRDAVEAVNKARLLISTSKEK